MPSGQLTQTAPGNSTFLRGAATGPESQSRGRKLLSPQSCPWPMGPALGTMSTWWMMMLKPVGTLELVVKGVGHTVGNQCKGPVVCPVCYGMANLSVSRECGGGTQHFCTLLESTQAPVAFMCNLLNSLATPHGKYYNYPHFQTHKVWPGS